MRNLHKNIIIIIVIIIIVVVIIIITLLHCQNFLLHISIPSFSWD